MENLSTKSILVVDHGLFLSFAVRMAQKDGFGKVLYCNATRSGRPTFSELLVGKGYEGIEVVKDPETYLDQVDVIALPDVLLGAKAKFWRKLGYAVWGSGTGEELELYRLYWKKMVDALGLPVNDYEVVKGIPKLREFLKENDDRYIKISYMRGLMETRHHEDYLITKNHLDKLEYRLGPEADETEFIVEAPVETEIEIAADHYFVKRFPTYAINGVEIKDQAYAGIVQKYSEMPEQIQEVDNALAPVLAKCDYANFFAVELRVSKDGTPYPIDPCCRQASPAGEAQLAMWTNFPQIVYHGAHGELVDNEFDETHIVQAMMYSKSDDGDWCALRIPKTLRPFVNLYYGYRKGDLDYCVPQHDAFDEIGSVIGKGATLKEARDLCQKRAEQIKGDVTIKIEELDKAEKEFEAMQKMGMNTEPVTA